MYDTTNSVLQNHHIRCLALDDIGRLWIGSYGGLTSFDGQDWKQYDELNEIPGTFVKSILVDNDQNIWIGGCSWGLAKFDGEKWYFLNSINSGLSNNESSPVGMDKSGNLWINTNSGFDIYQEGGVVGEFREYREEPYSIPIAHIPAEEVFYHAFPNPFNQYATIQIPLDKPSFVKATVFDVLGREVETLVNDFKPSGSLRVVFNGRQRSSGVYLLRIEVDGKSSVKKMLYVR